MPTPNWWSIAEPGVHDAIGEFTEWISDKVDNLDPAKLVTTKNPFLFRARAENVDQFASMMIDAFVSSSEETKFGTILENIAVVVCQKAKGGRKSSTTNIDLEYDESGVRTVAQIKSGPNWGNSRQQSKLRDDFSSATRVLRQGSNMQVRCVEGICYGPSGVQDKGTHLKIIGEAFWKDISDWDGTGRAVLDAIGQHAGNGLLSVRQNAQSKMITFLRESGAASIGGVVDWDKVYELVMTERQRRPRNKSGTSANPTIAVELITATAAVAE